MLKLEIWEVEILIGENGSLIEEELGWEENQVSAIWVDLDDICLTTDRDDG